MITVSEQTELDNFELRSSMDQEKSLLELCIHKMLNECSMKEVVGYAFMYWEEKLDDPSQKHLKEEVIGKWRPAVLEEDVSQEAPQSK